MISTKLEKTLIILVVILGLIAYFSFSKWKSTDKDLTILKNSIKVEKNIFNTNSLLDEMISRENSIYPELYKKLEELKKQYVTITIKQDKLKTNSVIRKEKENEFSKANLNTLSNELNAMGFTNSIASTK